MNADAAKMEESKRRVLYAWSGKEKHGVTKPLPCEECFTWHSRLDLHLKNKHKKDSLTCANILNDMRAKYWCNANGKLNEDISSLSNGIYWDFIQLLFDILGDTN